MNIVRPSLFFVRPPRLMCPYKTRPFVALFMSVFLVLSVCVNTQSWHHLFPFLLLVIFVFVFIFRIVLLSRNQWRWGKGQGEGGQRVLIYASAAPSKLRAIFPSSYHSVEWPGISNIIKHFLSFSTYNGLMERKACTHAMLWFEFKDFELIYIKNS